MVRDRASRRESGKVERYGLRSIGHGRSYTGTQHTLAPVIRFIPIGGATCRVRRPHAPYVRRERSLCVLPGARAGHVRAVKAGLFSNVH